MKKLFLIDGNSLANRAFYGMPFLENKQGQPSGAIFGFANIITKLIIEEKPDELIVAFDVSRKTFRSQLYSEYKAQRKQMPDELKSQMPHIKEMLDVMKIKRIEQEGIEADDIIGTIAKTRLDVKKIIITGDRDLLQIVDPLTEVWITKKGITDLQKNTVENLHKNYGYMPYQVTHMKGLMGDSSDNIPGVEGVGEKTALKLIEEYSTIENVYENIENIKGKLQERLISNKEKAFLSKDLATIKTDCLLSDKVGEISLPFDGEVLKFFQYWNFSSLMKKKEIFDGVEIEEEVEIEKILITNIEDVQKLKNQVGKVFALNLEKREFSPKKGQVFCISDEISMFSQAVEIEKVLLDLKEVFENPNILKLTANAKSDMHKFDELQISYSNYFDISIANYLIYAGIKVNEDFQTALFFSQKESLEKQMEETGVEKLYYECELPLVDVLFNMEKDGIRIDEEKLEELSMEFSETHNQYKTQIFEMVGEEFNLNSPKQMSYILFDKLNIKSYNNKKKSTSMEILEDIIDNHPIIPLIIACRKIGKLLSTYINVYEKICKDKGNVVHTIYKQTLTSTGRLSSVEPNLQNIPTRDENGRKLKKIFISKFENGKILSADYNQIELRLMAHLSKEQNLINAYNKGVDIHSFTASKIFNLNIENVDSNQRRMAKAVNFGVIYGISDYGLSQQIKSSRQDAKYFIENFFNKNPAVKEYSEKCVEFAEKNGYIKTIFGRIRKIPEISSSNKIIQSFAKRTAMNMPLQGSASDIIKFAMIRVFEKLKNMKSQLILQIHDELVIDVYPQEEEKVMEIVKNEMENVIKLDVELPVSMNIGKSLFDCK